MPARQLHTQRLPADTQVSTRETLRRRTRSAGSLTGGTSPVESIAVQPGQTEVEVTFRGLRAKTLAKEVAGLFDAPDYEVAAYFGVNESTDEDGYYVMEDSADSPAEVRDEGTFYTVAGTMRKRGTRRSHYRSMTTKVTTVDNDFGNDETATVSINDAARQVRWYRKSDGAVSPASTLGVTPTEHGSVATYDPTSAPYDNPTLIFDLPYDEEGREDIRVWDDRDGDRLDSDGYVRWRKVYHPRFDPDGSFVLANDILRVYLNDDDPSVPLSAERWNDTTSAYESVALGSSDWGVAYVDVRRIGTARVVALVDFEDSSTGDQYGLRATLTRGDENILWTRTKNATSATPQGLVDLLSPIAQTRLYQTGENDALVARTEVER